MPPEKRPQVPKIHKTDLLNAYFEYVWPIFLGAMYVRPLHHIWMSEVLDIKEGNHVLELGSGYPLYKFYADQVGENGSFIALDNNHNIQRRSRKIYNLVDSFSKDKKNKMDQSVRQITASDQKIPFADNAFDIVVGNNFINLGPAEFFDVMRVLKPEGRLVFTWNELFSLPIITLHHAKLFKQLGLENIKVRPSAPGAVLPGIAWNWYVEATKPNQIFKLA